MGIAQVNAVLSARGLSRITNDGSAMDIHNIVYSTANSSAFADVTSGSNDIHSLGGYNAMTGFDMVTGMGVPNFATLANLLVARLSPSGGGGSSSPESASTPSAGTPVTPTPAIVAPNPVTTVVVPPTVENLGGGVLVSTGANTAVTPRVTSSAPATRKLRSAPRLAVPVRAWRVPVLTVPGGAREFTAYLKINGRWVPIGDAESSRKGKVALPGLRMTRAGKYPVRLSDERGRSYFVVLKAAKRR
jgi:hypothetical protein